jgi:hypothetical protein
MDVTEDQPVSLARLSAGWSVDTRGLSRVLVLVRGGCRSRPALTLRPADRTTPGHSVDESIVKTESIGGSMRGRLGQSSRTVRSSVLRIGERRRLQRLAPGRPRPFLGAGFTRRGIPCPGRGIPCPHYAAPRRRLLPGAWPANVREFVGTSPRTGRWAARRGRPHGTSLQIARGESEGPRGHRAEPRLAG